MKRVIVTWMLLAALCFGNGGFVFASGQVVSAEETGAQETAAALVMPEETEIFHLLRIVNLIYARDFWVPGGEYFTEEPLVSVRVKSSDLRPEERADFLYWYVSFAYAADDPRVLTDDSEAVASYGISYNTAGQMLRALIGTAEEEDIQAYVNNNCYRVEGDVAYVGAQTGGAESACTISSEFELTEEDGRLRISGNIFNSISQEMEANYTIYCVPKEDGLFGGYVFDELVVDAGDSPADAAGTEGAGASPVRAQNTASEWLSPDAIWATSVHYTEGIDSYEPQRVNDGDVTTGWVEGVDGPGTGEYIELSYPEDVVFESVWIVPGFCKREDLFYRNNAPVELEFSSGGKSVVTDISSGAVDYYRAVEGIEYALPEELPCDGVLRVTIRNVRPGSEWDDTVISELKMKGFHRN